MFKLYDTDNSGRLDGFELRQALNSAGYRLNNHILNILSHRYGNRDGQVTFDDFMMCAVRLKAMIGQSSIIDTHLNTKYIKKRKEINTQRAWLGFSRRTLERRPGNLPNNFQY